MYGAARGFGVYKRNNMKSNLVKSSQGELKHGEMHRRTHKGNEGGGNPNSSYRDPDNPSWGLGDAKIVFNRPDTVDINMAPVVYVVAGVWVVPPNKYENKVDNSWSEDESRG